MQYVDSWLRQRRRRVWLGDGAPVVKSCLAVLSRDVKRTWLQRGTEWPAVGGGSLGVWECILSGSLYTECLQSLLMSGVYVAALVGWLTTAITPRTGTVMH